MNNELPVSSSNWQEWLIVCGYLGFMLFVAWKVLTSKKAD